MGARRMDRKRLKKIFEKGKTSEQIVEIVKRRAGHHVKVLATPRGA